MKKLMTIALLFSTTALAEDIDNWRQEEKRPGITNAETWAKKGKVELPEERKQAYVPDGKEGDPEYDPNKYYDLHGKEIHQNVVDAQDEEAYR